MKRFLLVILASLFMASMSQAYEGWLASTTSTSTGPASVNKLCDYGQRGIFHGVCTDYGVASASMTIVNSTYTFSGAAGVTKVGPISTLVADQCKYFDTVMPNAATVTILYQCQ